MNEDNILYELDALISEISDPIQLRTLNRIAEELKRLQKVIEGGLNVC
jgi:predicted amino acid racemase